MADVEKLNEKFAPNGPPLPNDVVDELALIMRLHALSPEELFFKWESYVMKMGVENIKMEYRTVKDFKKDVQDVLERESRAKGHHLAQSGTKKAAPTPRSAASNNSGDVFGMLDGMSSVTPSAKLASKRKADNFATPSAKSVKNGINSSPSDSKAPSAISKDSQSIAFEDRQNAGQVIESLNAHLPSAAPPPTPHTDARVKLKANTELPKFAYKGMAMKQSESSEILDERIDSFTDLIQAHHQLPDGAFGNPAAQSTAEIVAVGRIACDTPNGKLNAASLVLETSRRMGAGMRVPLKFDNVGYDLFPGKIVALRGTNVSGEYFSATEMLDIPLLPISASTLEELDVHNDRIASADGEKPPLNILLASGPYTTDTDLSFAPLHAILSKAESQLADVLILTGPFLDLEHPLVASGDFASALPDGAKIHPDRATVNDIFRVLIGTPISSLVQAVPTITIILVPSLRDAVAKSVSWPQDRFAKAALGLPKNVQVVTNPITLSINEMIFGISTQDVLSELRRENVHQGRPGQAFQDDILARLAGSVIEQRHFFPVYPPQARENLPKPTPIPGEVAQAIGGEERVAVGASLDLGYLKLGEWLNVRPDVLVLPSALSPFAKVVNSVVCINPGTLSKRRGAGSYASLCVAPRTLTDEEREADSAVAHEVFGRARVDVVRI